MSSLPARRCERLLALALDLRYAQDAQDRFATLRMTGCFDPPTPCRESAALSISRIAAASRFGGAAVEGFVDQS